MKRLCVAWFTVALLICACSSQANRQDHQETDRERWKAKYADTYAKGRTIEEVQLAFEKRKADFYRTFNAHSGLPAGEAIVGLTIAADGHVSDCHLVSTSFFNSVLESELVDLVRTMNFGAREVPAFYIAYPLRYQPLRR